MGLIRGGVIGVGVGVGRAVGTVDGERAGGRYVVMFDSMGALGVGCRLGSWGI